ncbi:MAG: hypothetical protein A2Z35_06100 [Actinobacteria bacterium RBG_19FT_COMBO_36_27]|nr:MAG: hypothetical protein A2Z35_06100 [Actinobacteria bacterium RBG_19FT_COMBO_36_27]
MDAGEIIRMINTKASLCLEKAKIFSKGEPVSDEDQARLSEIKDILEVINSQLEAELTQLKTKNERIKEL